MIEQTENEGRAPPGENRRRARPDPPERRPGHGRIPGHRQGRRRHIVKFRVDRDVLADAVAWTARSIPTRPGTLPQLSGIMVATGDRRPPAQRLRLRDVRAGRPFRPRSPTRARSWSRGGCSPTSPVRCRTSPVEVALDGAKVSLTCGSSRFSLQTMPVEDYPALPEMPAVIGTVDTDAVHVRGRPGRHRRGTRRHAAGAHRRQARDRGLHALPARDRPVPAEPARAALAAPTSPTCPSARWCPPGCCPTPPSRCRAGAELKIALALRAPARA